MNRNYKILSFLLSPPLIALYVTIIFSLFSPIGLGSIDIFSSIIIGLIFLVLIPIGSIYYFSRGDFEVDKRDQRTKLYLISIISYLASSGIFWLLNSHIMFVLSMSYVFVSSADAIVNLFWKISAHASGTAGPITAIVFVFGLQLIPLYVLTLLAFWIRLRLKVHNILQLVVGALIAIFITSIVYTILW